MKHQKEMPKEKVGQLVKNLKSSFKDDWFNKHRKAKAVQGVMVFRAGEGGAKMTVTPEW